MKCSGKCSLLLGSDRKCSQVLKCSGARECSLYIPRALEQFPLLRISPRSRTPQRARSYSTIGINISSGSTTKSPHSCTRRNPKSLGAKGQSTVEPVLNEHNRARRSAPDSPLFVSETEEFYVR